MILRFLMLVAILANPVLGAEANYLRVVTNYANALLTHGRDKVGPVRSPLVAATLDRATFAMYDRESAPPIVGVRDRERVMEGANPMHDQNLYQILYALSALTGDEKYAMDADRTLGWFLEHCAHPSTHLYAWGEHMGWDFQHERSIRKIAGKLHELFRPWALWDRCYALDPKASFRFAKALWENQIGDQETGNYSKHALYDQHGPTINGDEPRHAGFYLATWAAAFVETCDDRYLRDLAMGTWSIVFTERRDRSLAEAMEMLTVYMEKRRSPQSGAILADSGTPTKSEPWRSRLVLPIDNLSLAVDLGWSAQRVEAVLSGDMKLTASRIDSAFLKMQHDPAGKGFIVGADVYTLKPYGAQESQWSRPWTDRGINNPFRDHGGFVIRSHAAVANLCFERFKQTGLYPYHDLVVKTSQWYLDNEPKVSGVGVPNILTRTVAWFVGGEPPLYPRMMGQVIKLMLNTYELTGSQKYLARADHFAQWSIQTFLDESPLPRASHRNDHYESVTGGDALMMAILELWTVKSGRWDEVELVWVDR
ncbi:MAG: hypothetical protein VX910_01435 [Candidatus Latescibacterota bacterium]|nr:hypothetical protein [Candidatus Latescibacterota bacterium]